MGYHISFTKDEAFQPHVPSWYRSFSGHKRVKQGRCCRRFVCNEPGKVRGIPNRFGLKRVCASVWGALVPAGRVCCQDLQIWVPPFGEACELKLLIALIHRHETGMLELQRCLPCGRRPTGFLALQRAGVRVARRFLLERPRAHKKSQRQKPLARMLDINLAYFSGPSAAGLQSGLMIVSVARVSLASLPPA